MFRRFAFLMSVCALAWAMAAAQLPTAPQPTTPSTTAPAHARRHAKRHAASTAPASPPAPVAPKSGAMVTQDLTARFHAGSWARDAISANIAGDVITLTGKVRRAEQKGEATRVARDVARKDGWAQFHVINKLEVN